MSACKACGGPTEWEPDVGSNICTQCGTLEDASQVVLASQLEPHELGSYRDRPFPGASLKSLRAPGWNLVGQGKEARDARNKAAIHEFIKTLAAKLGCPGLADRAENLFNVAMDRGKLRWGRKAKLTAASALAIACREAHRSDPLRELAVSVGESVTSLARVYTTTAGLVGYLTVSSDPSLHFPALKAHLDAVLRPPDGSPPAELPPALRKELVALLPQALAVERTAALLCALFDRLGTFVQLATPPTACALFVLALEAEARKPLPASAALASVLGARFGCAGSTVQTRYKAAYDVAESWVSELPWAGAYHKVGARAKSARAKEGKRAVVAKSLKDAVVFQEEIWLKKVGAAHVTLVLEEDDGHESDSSAPSTVSSKRSVPDDDIAEDAVRAQYSRKRRKAAPTEADAASSFLLNAALASSSKTSRPDVRVKSEGDLCLLTHLLSADLCSLSLSVPTRLQILSTVRGGADRVLDEELFENDELEAFLRPPEEVDAFARTVDWPDDSQLSATRLRAKSGPKPKAPKGSERINMDRLARLLGEAGDGLDDDKEDDIDAWDDLVGLGVSTLDKALAFDDDKDGDSENEYGGTAHGSAGVADEEVEEWRPASPGGGGGREWCEF